MKYMTQGKTEPLIEVLSTLSDLNRDDLLEHWVQLYDMPAPRISTSMLRQAIAYKVQECHYGKLRPALRRYLKYEAMGINKTVPALLKPGTRLIRQWRGTTYEVIITPDGVLLNGKKASSLTEAAYRITGAKWSGPRFFGLVKGGQNARSKAA